MESLFFLTENYYTHTHILNNIKFVYHVHDYNIMTCYRHRNALKYTDAQCIIHVTRGVYIVFIARKVLEYSSHNDQLIAKIVCLILK